MASLTLRRLTAEYEIFATRGRPLRRLLIANSVYALVLPVVEIFVAAFIMRKSQSPVAVVHYQMVIYAATVVGFALNGFLLRTISAARLYSAGMVLTGVSLFLLMLPGLDSYTGRLFSAVLLGAASGLFWGNRALFVLSATRDKDRNYYYGVEASVLTITSIAVPAAIAWLFARCDPIAVSSGDTPWIYGSLAFGALMLSSLSALMILHDDTEPTPNRPFLFVRQHPLWRRMLCVATFKAVAQGYIVTAPAILIFRFIGQEKALGIVEAIGGAIGAFCLYYIGRASKPEHRIVVFGAGQFLLLVGSAVSAAFFNIPGVMAFMIFLLLAKPLIDLGYYPIQFLVTNEVARYEGRSTYSYIMSHECATFLGRFVGCCLFIGISERASDTTALRYALPAIAVLELPSILVARMLLQGIRILRSVSEPPQCKTSTDEVTR